MQSQQAQQKRFKNGPATAAEPQDNPDSSQNTAQN